MKGFNPGKGTGIGSAFEKSTRRTRKTSQKRVDISKAMYKEGDYMGEPTKYSDQQKREGAGSSAEFFKTEGGEGKTKRKFSVERTNRRMDGSTRTYNVGKKKGQAGKRVLAVVDKGTEYKRDKKGKVKTKRNKDTAKKSIFGKKRTIQLDSYAEREGKTRRAIKKGADPTEAYKNEADFGTTKFTGEGSGKHHKGDDKRKRKAVLHTRGKKAGMIEEKIKRKSGIGYRKTGRVIEDQAYKDSQKITADKKRRKKQRERKQSKNPNV